MDLAPWANHLIDLVRDFAQDTQQDIESGVTPSNQTDDEWWTEFQNYKEATGS